jgi:hypothetical protein
MAPIASISQPMLLKTSATIANAMAKGVVKSGIIINQWREKAGVSFGDPRSLPGGKMVRYYSRLEMEVYNKKQVMEPDENDMETIAYNEQTFKIMRYSAGNSLQEGEYIMNRRETERLGEAEIDDFDVVVRYAQKFKIVTGAGVKWQLVHPYTGEVMEFKNKSSIVELVEQDVKLKADLEQKMISLQRKKNGLSEDGWW